MSLELSDGTEIYKYTIKLVDKKSDGNLYLFIYYQVLNNFTIKNYYLLAWIDESLDKLCQTKHVTQIDLTSAIEKKKIKEGNEWKRAFHLKYGHFEY